MNTATCTWKMTLCSEANATGGCGNEDDEMAGHKLHPVLTNNLGTLQPVRLNENTASEVGGERQPAGCTSRASWWGNECRPQRQSGGTSQGSGLTSHCANGNPMGDVSGLLHYVHHWLHTEQSEMMLLKQHNPANNTDSTSQWATVFNKIWITAFFI